MMEIKHINMQRMKVSVGPTNIQNHNISVTDDKKIMIAKCARLLVVTKRTITFGGRLQTRIHNGCWDITATENRFKHCRADDGSNFATSLAIEYKHTNTGALKYGSGLQHSR